MDYMLVTEPNGNVITEMLSHPNLQCKSTYIWALLYHTLFCACGTFFDKVPSTTKSCRPGVWKLWNGTQLWRYILV